MYCPTFPTPLGSTTVMRPYTKTIYASGMPLPSTTTLATKAPAACGALADHKPLRSPVLPEARSTPNDLPLTSAMVKANASMTRLTCVQRDQWARDNLPSRVQVGLAIPFGKDSLSHTFSSAVEFRHVLVFVFKSGFLIVRTKRAFLRVSPFACRLVRLIARYGTIDFTPLRQGISTNLPTPELIAPTQSLVTACFLHFNFDTPSVGYIGGQHIAAHRDVPAIMKELRRAGVDPAVLVDLERIYTIGSPALCNAATTEKNFRAFMAYGNHKTIAEDIPKTQQALVKDIRRGYVLIMDPWLTFFVPNLHRTPLGMVDLNKPHKNPRPIFYSSFCLSPWAMAINDFTSKLSEPEIVFPLAWIKYLTWLWNLRITYPWVELYLGDDDVSGAFRQIKYNPNLVAMHAFLVFGILFMSTGQTFGDCTSPANWEPVARNRQQYARFLWMQIATLVRGLPHLPKLIFAPPASQATVAHFVQATPNSLNTGVLDQHGARLPPQYDHHVDDCLYLQQASLRYTFC
jgi:hypothetical protein